MASDASPSYNLLCVMVSLCVSVAFVFPFSCNGGAESYFFILGDSLFDAGNNQYISSYSYIPGYHLPYGKTYFPLHPTGRYSDGRLAPDFIASKLNLPFMPPILKPGANFTHGANFASAGAAATLNVTNAARKIFLCLSDDFWETGPTVQGVSSKLDERTWHRSEAKRRLGSAVYLISIGGNDYFRQSSSNSDDTIPEQQEYVDKVIETIFQDVQEIYNGGRKFMFQNVGPLGCVPMSKQMSDMSDEACVGLQITLAILHNNALVKKLRKLTSENSWPGFVFSVFDYFTAVGNRIKDPTTYGFKFGDVACCGVGSYRGLECGSLTQSYELCFNPSEYMCTLMVPITLKLSTLNWLTLCGLEDQRFFICPSPIYLNTRLKLKLKQNQRSGDLTIILSYRFHLNI
ncbi:hypothetical protein Pint_30462 [Pistacia integerrima]|uniref:Uncharacterized protein n=1 Tax=Pistacia integerrima TaxID=434235 RepID=A0ACC0X2V8_9ROSI|nr:hypothetical protein Pint_30462 [Pistacia integerrima]